ncbi:MAG TPA: hypothetical protein VEA69_10860 [Tepidisphaeraceae bacterium]|nr:hypothetical protein [Tepidisphaeraceae bacterium]
MDKKTFGIGILSITAVLLGIACLLPTPKADAAFAVKDRDYQLITAANQQGGDTLYVVDNRTGLMAIFMYNNNQGVMRPMQVRPVSMAFEK